MNTVEFIISKNFLKKYTQKKFIYVQKVLLNNKKKDGILYFVEGMSVGSDFGFPRVEIKKKYRWYYFSFKNKIRKKMNFTTVLPKKRPLVTYIVQYNFKKNR